MRAVVFGLGVLLATVVAPARGEAQLPAQRATVRVATVSGGSLASSSPTGDGRADIERSLTAASATDRAL